MKKIFITKALVVLILIITLFSTTFFVGCGGNNSTDSSDRNQSSSAIEDSGNDNDSSSGISDDEREPSFEDHVKQIETCDDVVLDYFAAETEQEQYNIMNRYKNTKHDSQTEVKIYVKNGNAPYLLKVADNTAMESAFTKTSYAKQIIFGGTFVPGKTYYYEVEDCEQTIVYRGTINVAKSPVRVISVGGGANIRDIGGYAAGDGYRVKYGLLIRGAQLNGRNGGPMLTADGIATMRNILGVKTELDLRNAGVDDGGQTVCFFGEDKTYLKYNFQQYDRALTSPGNLELIKEIFAFLADENNYPIYFHCNAGADRTGTLTYLINGLLGVSYENLTKDFELTSFGGQGQRLRSDDTGSGYGTTGVFQDNSSNYVAWGKMHKYILDNYPSEATLSEKIEKFLIEKAGCEKSNLDKIKTIMLEEIA